MLPQYSQSTGTVLPGYSQGTGAVLPEYWGSSPRVLAQYSQGTPRVVPDYSQSRARVLPEYPTVLIWVLPEYMHIPPANQSTPTGHHPDTQGPQKLMKPHNTQTSKKSRTPAHCPNMAFKIVSLLRRLFSLLLTTSVN